MQGEAGWGSPSPSAGFEVDGGHWPRDTGACGSRGDDSVARPRERPARLGSVARGDPSRL